MQQWRNLLYWVSKAGRFAKFWKGCKNCIWILKLNYIILFFFCTKITSSETSVLLYKGSSESSYKLCLFLLLVYCGYFVSLTQKWVPNASVGHKFDPSGGAEHMQ